MACFEINQAIIHIPEGVCRVTDLIERNISGIGSRKYYVLTPVYDRGAKIYVPADSENPKVLPIVGESEVFELIDSLPSAESVWVENDKKRQESFAKILSGCDRREMIRLLSTLRQKAIEKKKLGKKFHSSDERVLRETQRLLFGEFGFILGISPKEVPDFIENRLLQADSGADAC
ncbi:MAG: CarD family transcriptional regulator [Lachnospiraceae bacterium]